MKMQRGFSFIEVITSVLISSIIGMVLFQSLSQFSKALNTITNTSVVQTEKIVLDRQWDRDFSGMFAPLKKLPAEREQENGKPSEQPSTEPKKTLEPKEQKDKDEEEKFHSDPFVYTAEQDGLVTMLSCITSNPALMYGNLLPRIVRVVYRLVPNKMQEGVYILMRQQSEDLDLNAFNNTQEGKVRAYELATGIKRLKVEAWAEKIIKKGKAQPQQQPNEKPQEQKTPPAVQMKEEKPQPRVFIPWHEWQKMDKEEKKKLERALVPALIKITVTFVKGMQEVDQVLWYAPAYGLTPIVIEGPSLLATDGERRTKKQAEEQYGKINEQLQDFNERVLSKKMEQK